MTNIKFDMVLTETEMLIFADKVFYKAISRTGMAIYDILKEFNIAFDDILILYR